MTKFKIALILILGMMFFAVGCDDGDEEKAVAIDQQEATLNVNANFEKNIVGVANSAKFVNDSPMVVNGISNGMGMMDDDDSMEPTPVPDGSGGGDTIDLDFSQEAQELVDFLEAEVFTAANVEETSDTSVTYRLKADTMCVEIDDYDGTEYVDEGCQQMLTDFPIRFVVSSTNGTDMDIDLVVGTDRLNPLSFEVYDAHLAVEADLGDIKGAIDAMMNMQGAEGEEMPEIAMDGKIKAKVERESANVYKLTFGVTEALSVSAEGMSLSVAKAPDAYSLKIDGDAKAITFGVDVNAITMEMPGDLMSSNVMECEYDMETGEENCTEYEDSPFDGLLGVALDGITGSLVFDGNEDKLNFQGLGLNDGGLSLTLDGQEFFGLEVSTFDALVTSIAGGEGATIEITPSFSMVADMAFNLIDEEADAWVTGNTLSVLLDGESPKVQVDESGLQLLSGHLKISDNSVTHEADAPACIVDVEGDGSNPLTELSLGACP